MKISISYIPEEAREADLIFHFVRNLCPGVRTHESDRHPPFKHLYLTTKRPSKKPETPCNSKEKH